MRGWAGICAHWHDRRITTSCHTHVRHGWGHFAGIHAGRTWLATCRWGWGWRRDEETWWRWWGSARVEAGGSLRTAVVLLLVRWFVRLLLFWRWRHELLLFWCRHKLLLVGSRHELLLVGSRHELLFRCGHKLLLGVRCRHVASHGRCLLWSIWSWLLLVCARIITVGTWGAAASFAGLRCR